MNESRAIAQMVANGRREWWKGTWTSDESESDERRERNKLDAWRVGVKINTLTMLTPINLSVAIVLKKRVFEKWLELEIWILLLECVTMLETVLF